MEILKVNPEYSEESMDDIDIKKDSDDVLSNKIDVRIAEAENAHKNKLDEIKEYVKMFAGDYDGVFGEDISKYKSRKVINKPFLTIRNLVGLSTDNPATCTVVAAKDMPQSKKKAQNIESCIEDRMLTIGFNDMIAACLFDTWIKSDSYMTWFWNYETKNIDAKPCLFEEIMLAPGAETIQEAEYLIYAPLKNKLWWKKNYPNYYDDIQFETAKDEEGIIETTEKGHGRPNVARFIQYWENEFCVFKVKGKDGKDIILEKKLNPYFEFRSTDEQLMEWVGINNPEALQVSKESGVGIEEVMAPEELEQFKPILNFLNEPRKPFVQIPSIKLLGQKYSTSLMKQGKETFFSIIDKKRRIDDNLRGCNVKIIVDQDVMSEEEAAAITDEPLQVITVPFSSSGGKPVYTVNTAEGFDINKIREDIFDDQQYVDDLFGHHEISRGAGRANTLGQDKMNFTADQTPVRFQVRATERAIREVWEGWIQLIKMFYTEIHYIKKYGEQEGLKILELTRHDVEDGIEPILRPGSTMPRDKAGEGDLAVNLASSGLLDPYSMYVALEKQNPTELSNRLVNWTNFRVISEEDPATLQADMQDQSGSDGDTTENPVEMADQENRAMQNGDEVPPTPPQIVTKDHVKLHYAFANDSNKKMEDTARDMVIAHAEVDKATLEKKLARGMVDEGGRRVGERQQANK